MKPDPPEQKMDIVIAGHVDHGKSTVVGRLLADTGSLPQGKLEQVRLNCERNSKPFEYAFLIDALKDEQSQGITIDSARVFFKTKKRHYIIIDAPGHIEFLKNMVTGAARAEAALLVIDAAEGIQENSKRHGYMLSMLGIKQIAILVNKMDLVSYSKQIFDRITDEYGAFLSEIQIKPTAFIPVSGIGGDNIAVHSPATAWHKGWTVLEILDQFVKEKAPADKPFRMPVQDVYKFTKFGDNRRIVAGTVESGTVRVGEEIVFYPSGKKSCVKSIESFNREIQHGVAAGAAAGLVLEEQVYATRGELAVRANEPRPKITSSMKTSLFWLGKEPMVKDKDYVMKLATARVPVKLESVTRVIDASDLRARDDRDFIERHDVAECTLKLGRAIAFDLAEDMVATGRFVVVDGYEISGGGIILQDIEDKQSWVRDKVLLRNYKWEKSIIPAEQRAQKLNQKPVLIIITGEKDSGKKPLAKRLEAQLFADGKIVYFLSIGNVLYGVDADIKGTDNRQEALRRLAEVAHILLDIGIILIVTAIRLTQEDLDIIKTIVNPDRIEVIWVGENVTTDISVGSKVKVSANLEESVDALKAELQEKGIIF